MSSNYPTYDTGFKNPYNYSAKTNSILFFDIDVAERKAIENKYVRRLKLLSDARHQFPRTLNNIEERQM